MNEYTRIVATCPHCGVPGKGQDAKVGISESGFGWAVCSDEGRALQRTGFLTCEACGGKFAYELAAIPAVFVSAINWQAST